MHSVVVVLALVLITGCMSVKSPAIGVLYTELKAPLDAEGDSVTFSKVGKATCTSIMGLVATGDASISTAMEDGGITRLHHVDYEVKNVLGFIGEFTIVAYGD